MTTVLGARQGPEFRPCSQLGLLPQSVKRISSARPTTLPQTGTRHFGASPTRPTDNNMIPAQTLLPGSESKAVSTDDNITTTTVSTSTPNSGSSSDKNVILNRDVNFVTTNSGSVVPATPATVNNMNTTKNHWAPQEVNHNCLNTN